MPLSDGDAALVSLLLVLAVALVIWEWVVNHRRDKICAGCSVCKQRVRDAHEQAMKRAGRCVSCGWLLDGSGHCQNDRCREH